MAGLLKEAAAKVRKAGAKGSQDKILAHITPEEAALLKRRGGSGRIDPKTGLPHFDMGDGDGGLNGDPGTQDPGGASDDGPGGSSDNETNYNDTGGQSTDSGDWGGFGGWSFGGQLGGFGLGDVEGGEGQGKGQSKSEQEDQEEENARNNFTPGEYKSEAEKGDEQSARDEYNAANSYNQAYGKAIGEEMSKAIDGFVGKSPEEQQAARDEANRGGKSWALVDLTDKTMGQYIGDLRSGGVDAKDVGSAGRSVGVVNDYEGQNFGRGYGGRGELNSALDKGGYGYGDRASAVGAVNAALNYGPVTQGLMDLGMLATTIANPVAGLSVAGIDTGGKALAGGDVGWGEVGDLTAAGLGIGVGPLAGITARGVNDIGVKGMDPTEAVASQVYGVVGGLNGSMLGGLIGQGKGAQIATDVSAMLGAKAGGAMFSQAQKTDSSGVNTEAVTYDSNSLTSTLLDSNTAGATSKSTMPSLKGIKTVKFW